MGNEILTSQEAADYLRMHINTLYNQREIPKAKIGGKYKFRREALDKYLEEKEKQQGGKQ